jgi:3-oxocholest-4-en-26-oyl-CoA dehydrogenase beta subunit
MDFRINKEQEMLRESARDFLKKRCDAAVVREIEAGGDRALKKLWKASAKLDWMSILIPEEYDGMGWGILDQAILCEEFGRAAMPGPMLTNIMGMLLLLEGGNDRQKLNILPDIAGGGTVLALAFDEEESHFDPRFNALEAKTANSGYQLKGSKLFVPYAEFANHLIVSARTSGMPGDENGITLFIVDAGSKQIKITPLVTMSGDRQYQVDFNDVLLTADDIIGEVDTGYSLAVGVLEKGTALQCVEMVGGAQKELDMTADYLKTREQFGKPLGTFQAIQHRLADMYIAVQGARWISYQAVWQLNEGMNAGQAVSRAKVFANRAAQQVAFSAQQLHGGMGVDMEYDIQIYYRRAKGFELKLGTSDFHLERIEQAL